MQQHSRSRDTHLVLTKSTPAGSRKERTDRALTLPRKAAIRHNAHPNPSPLWGRVASHTCTQHFTVCSIWSQMEVAAGEMS